MYIRQKLFTRWISMYNGNCFVFRGQTSVKYTKNYRGETLDLRIYTHFLFLQCGWNKLTKSKFRYIFLHRSASDKWTCSFPGSFHLGTWVRWSLVSLYGKQTSLPGREQNFSASAVVWHLANSSRIFKYFFSVSPSLILIRLNKGVRIR